MARPRAYHQDRPTSSAERMRAYRKREKLLRDETPDMSTVTKLRTTVTKRVTKPVTKPVTKSASLRDEAAGPCDLRLIRLVEPILAANGVRVLTKTIELCALLPEPYASMTEGAVRQKYRRSLESRPPEYDQWLFLARQWAGRQWDRDVVDDLITIAIANNHLARLRNLFDSLKQQWGGENKFSQLRRYRDRLNSIRWTGRGSGRSAGTAL